MLRSPANNRAPFGAFIVWVCVCFLVHLVLFFVRFGFCNNISLIERIVVYISQNYSQPLNVSEIGKAVGLHPDYANSIFKKVFGCTLYEYVIQERIAHAQRKLVLSDLSITEIAFDCGFNSISRFNAAFLKLTAYRPVEYRKRYSKLNI